MNIFVKRSTSARNAYEMAGLAWLRDVEDGAPVVRIIRKKHASMEQERVITGPATAQAAHAFGRLLAITHAAGAPAFGAGPANYEGPMFMGELELETMTTRPTRWGDFYARYRILPYITRAYKQGALTLEGALLLEKLCDRLIDGRYEHDQPSGCKRVARLHGDLWTGNILWRIEGTQGAGGLGLTDEDIARLQGKPVVGTLIDPAAQGGHAESDLAQIGVFGFEHWQQVYNGYNEVAPLSNGWQRRIGLHQLHMLLVHAVLFPGTFGHKAVEYAKTYL